MPMESGHTWAGNEFVTSEEAMAERRRHFNYLRRLILGCFLVLAILAIVLSYKTEHDSCVRGNVIRNGFNLRGQTNVSAGVGAPGDHIRVTTLDCGGLWPSHNSKLIVGKQ